MDGVWSWRAEGQEQGAEFIAWRVLEASQMPVSWIQFCCQPAGNRAVFGFDF